MLDIFFFHLCPHLTGAALGQITKVHTHMNEFKAFDLLTFRTHSVCQYSDCDIKVLTTITINSIIMWDVMLCGW